MQPSGAPRHYQSTLRRYISPSRVSHPPFLHLLRHAQFAHFGQNVRAVSAHADGAVDVAHDAIFVDQNAHARRDGLLCAESGFIKHRQIAAGVGNQRECEVKLFGKTDLAAFSCGGIERSTQNKCVVGEKGETLGPER